MLGYLLRRTGGYAVMTAVATSVAYLAAVTFLRPESRLLQASPRPTEEGVRIRLASYGLDPAASALERYRQWLEGVLLRWDWGRSPNGSPIAAEFLDRAAVSGRLLLLATVLQIALGVALGVYTAARQHRLPDRTVTWLSYLLACVPAPVVYLWVQMAGIFGNAGAGRRIVYVSGMSSPVPPEGVWARLADDAAHLLLPTLALTLVGYGGYQLLQRAVLLDEVDSDYVRTARAKGLSGARVMIVHVLRNSLVPVVTFLGADLGALMGGAIVTEGIFNIRGIGGLLYLSIRTREGATVVGVVTVLVLVFLLVNLLVDILYGAIDPRIRYE